MVRLWFYPVWETSNFHVIGPTCHYDVVEPTCHYDDIDFVFVAKRLDCAA